NPPQLRVTKGGRIPRLVRTRELGIVQQVLFHVHADHEDTTVGRGVILVQSLSKTVDPTPHKSVRRIGPGKLGRGHVIHLLANHELDTVGNALDLGSQNLRAKVCNVKRQLSVRQVHGGIRVSGQFNLNLTLVQRLRLNTVVLHGIHIAESFHGTGQHGRSADVYRVVRRPNKVGPRLPGNQTSENNFTFQKT